MKCWSKREDIFVKDSLILMTTHIVLTETSLILLSKERDCKKSTKSSFVIIVKKFPILAIVLLYVFESIKYFKVACVVKIKLFFMD